jgi:homocitrate synthase NifV
MLSSFHGIIGSTLREGEQTPGVCFTQEQRCEIIRGICQVGIEEMELGIASRKNSQLPGLFASARKLRDDSGGQQQFGLWCRCLPDDIDFAATCRPDVLSLSIPASDLHIKERLRKERNWITATLRQSVALAKKHAIPFISIGFEDATRADREFLCQLALVAADCGVQRLRLADTVGVASPSTIAALVHMVTDQSGLVCGVHTHNDFGMATANGIAAIEAGAGWIDATALGLGERAGNCRLEEAAAFLHLQKDMKRYQINLLPELCQTVSQAAGMAIARNHPVVGKSIFTCETGLHLHGLTVNPHTYEPYPPDTIGASRTLRFGRKSGKRALYYHLARSSHPVDDNRAEALYGQLRAQDNNHSEKILSEKELLQMAML